MSAPETGSRDDTGADLGKLIKFVPAILMVLYELRRMVRHLRQEKQS